MKHKTIKTKIYSYRFDISIKTEKEQYLKEIENAKKLTGLKAKDKNTTHYINFNSAKGYENLKLFRDEIKSLKEVEIETDCLFNNQFNTKGKNKEIGLRIYIWNELIYRNKDIKEGYYIEMTQELKNILHNTFKCGYCGKQYSKEEHENLSFCNSCLDSEYLKKDQLFLLRLKRIDDNTDRLHLNDCDSIALTEQYTKAQIKGISTRGIKRIKDLRDSLLKDRDKTIKDANSEYDGFIWLLDRGINTDNVIYYNHTETFCFGWKNTLSFEIEQELKNKLKDFPFKFELKV